MKQAVLVIDVQQGLCEGPCAAFDCAGTISRINLVTRKAKTAGVPVIFVQHETESGFLEYASEAWRLAQGLEASPTDLYLRKRTPDSFLRTGLERLLRDRRIERLVICGMHTEFCVDTTTRKALALGFPVVLVCDAHTTAGNSTLSPEQVIAHHTITLTNITSFGPRAIAVTSQEVSF